MNDENFIKRCVCSRCRAEKSLSISLSVLFIYVYYYKIFRSCVKIAKKEKVVRRKIIFFIFSQKNNTCSCGRMKIHLNLRVIKARNKRCLTLKFITCDLCLVELDVINGD